ncbi:GerAB/ArcD/ProY family transporter [Bacillus kexueae]|uniref:GerAB/ArcD/ProY family transporter n=1 Tax=Aeribacillus kexueae TaxID=2078952 RepID=UPI001FAF38F4
MGKISERHKISYFLVFFLIHSTQFGVGVLGFQRVVVQATGNDSWLPVLLAGGYVHILLWMIYKILKNSDGSLYTLHKSLFGKWIGSAFNLIWMAYFFIVGVMVLRTYIEVIEVWMFADLNKWIYSALIIILVSYIIMGGFRVVTGIAFLGSFLPLFLVVTFIIFPLEFAHVNNLMPAFSHSPKEVFEGVQKMTLTVLGFEVLLIFYPFIKNPEKSKKWAHFAILFTTILYFVIMLISILYFTEEELMRNTWATLTMWKIVEIPFVERFEYIGIANWGFVILPNICIALWCVNRGIKETFHLSYRKGVAIVLVLMFFLVNMLEGRNNVNQLNELLGQTGYYLMNFYIPFLFVVTWIREKMNQRRQRNETA